MADTKISDLTDGTTAESTDRIPVARAGANRYITSAYIKDYILGTANAFTAAQQFTTIELGHANDTTLARVSAGLVSVEGVNLVNVSLAQTLTNKTLTAPVLTTPTLGTPASGTLTNCSGLPQAGVVGLTTADSPQFTAIELGHASDTTIARVSAGLVSIEGVNVVTVSATQTLTNKTLTSPVLTTPALGTPASGTLTNCTGLPVATGVSGLGTGVATMLASATGAIADIAFVIDGGGAEITDGIKGDLEIPFACTITRATLLADQSGSIVIDVWKDTYANYPPTDADSITASAPPTISSAVKSQDATLTGWTTAVAAGDTLRFNVDSCTTITRATLSLRVTKT